MLIAMAGLPATGKSTVAARLAEELGGVVLNKDIVRLALFPAPVLDYSREQDDFCMAAIFGAAALIRRTLPKAPIIIDGRTFLRAYQVQELFAQARLTQQELCIIECVCADTVARERLEKDLVQNVHPARNRTFELYANLKANAELILIPHLVLNTGDSSLEECVKQCLQSLRNSHRSIALPKTANSAPDSR